MGTPLAPPSPPDPLRERARLLRTLAQQMERSELLQLPSLAGSDTWLGARPFDCTTDLRRLVGRFHLAVSELRASARLLDQRADAVVLRPGPS